MKFPVGIKRLATRELGCLKRFLIKKGTAPGANANVFFRGASFAFLS